MVLDANSNNVVVHECDFSASEMTVMANSGSVQFAGPSSFAKLTVNTLTSLVPFKRCRFLIFWFWSSFCALQYGSNSPRMHCIDNLYSLLGELNAIFETLRYMGGLFVTFLS